MNRDAKDHGCRIVTERSNPSGRRPDSGFLGRGASPCDVHTFADEVRLSLELADVSFADAAGILLLKELGSRGVCLTRANPFMAEQLKEGASFKEI